MGDRLAEHLYTRYVNSGSQVAGSDVPNWASLPSVDRERWEQVAALARQIMVARFHDSIDEVERQGVSELDAMRERWKRS